jgi:hypothetical protein
MVSYRVFSLPWRWFRIVTFGTSFRQHLGGHEVSVEIEVLAKY